MSGPAALRSPAMVRFFGRVMARSMRRRFHALRLARPGWPELAPDRSVIVYLNHPSWWDPAFVIVMATTRFADRPGYGPIDASMLQKYRFMSRIGLFGVERGAADAGSRFLGTALGLLADPRAMLWITPGGEMADPRERPVRLRPGLAHLIRRAPRAVVVPLALEYPFWTESTPEAVARFGVPFEAASLTELPIERMTDELAARLELTMDRLAEDARAREPARFLRLMGGRAGVGGIYDVWRRARAWAGGHAFDETHDGPGR